MRTLLNQFLKGCLILFPVVGTVYAVWFVLGTIDHLVGALFAAPMPGLGLVVAVVVNSHLCDGWSTRHLLQPRAIPGDGQVPQLVHSNNRPGSNSSCLTPLGDEIFRPEEEHVASGKHRVVPPFGCRHETVKEPA
jgi:hypothetical protein